MQPERPAANDDEGGGYDDHVRGGSMICSVGAYCCCCKEDDTHLVGMRRTIAIAPQSTTKKEKQRRIKRVQQAPEPALILARSNSTTGRGTGAPTTRRFLCIFTVLLFISFSTIKTFWYEQRRWFLNTTSTSTSTTSGTLYQQQQRQQQQQQQNDSSSGHNDQQHEQQQNAILQHESSPAVDHDDDGDKKDKKEPLIPALIEDTILQRNERTGRWKSPCPHEIPEIANRERDVHIYSATRDDRSGSVIRYMISAYAYAYKYNFTYMGGTDHFSTTSSDSTSSDDDHANSNETTSNKNVASVAYKRLQHEQLINVIGLQDVLRFVTPTQQDEQHDGFFLWNIVCGLDHVLTSDFLRHVRSIRRQPEQQQQQDDLLPAQSLSSSARSRSIVSSSPELQIPDNNDDASKKQKKHRKHVVVHVRRGDAQPCTSNKYRKRYWPNAYYIAVLNKHVFNKTDDLYNITNVSSSSSSLNKHELGIDIDKKNDNNDNFDDIDITILSESHSMESFDIFHNAGYNVLLDGELDHAWDVMLHADILIMSPGSYFSFVPAILNTNANNDYDHDHDNSNEDTTTPTSPSHIYYRTNEYNFRMVDTTIQRYSRSTILNELIETQCQQFLIDYPQHLAKRTQW